MVDLIARARAVVAEHVERFRNRDFLEAAMAAAALVSQADGSVNFTEATTVDQALDAVHRLNIYDRNEAADLYRSWIDELESDPEDARSRIMKAVHEISDDEEAARILIRICIAIAKSDETIDDAERETVNELADALGLDSSTLDI
jgi:tellurite resistance protein TerB